MNARSFFVERKFHIFREGIPLQGFILCVFVIFAILVFAPKVAPNASKAVIDACLDQTGRDNVRNAERQLAAEQKRNSDLGKVKDEISRTLNGFSVQSFCRFGKITSVIAVPFGGKEAKIFRSMDGPSGNYTEMWVCPSEVVQGLSISFWSDKNGNLFRGSSAVAQTDDGGATWIGIFPSEEGKEDIASR